MPRALAERALTFFKTVLDQFAEEIANFGTAPTMYAGLVDSKGGLQWYNGLLKFRDAEGATVATDIPARDYAQFIGEAAMRDSYRSEEHTSELQSLRHLVCRFLRDTPTAEIYTLSLHDALPIYAEGATVATDIPARDYAQFIGEAAMRDSY